ncbi:MAG TPA: MFS transporter [Gaiellaceae bacterium]|jgi:MFS family permease|nr:MFS transporter [Gaiellaceae bacterium]
MRRLLSHRDVRLLLAGQTLSAFGDWAMWIVLAVWMKTLTGSSARAGLVFFVLGLGNLAGPLGGLLADRVKRRPLMIVCDCVLGASVLVLLLLHNANDAWLIYLVAFLYGTVGSVFYPARSALLRLMLPEELLAEANGVLSSVQQGLRIVAPLAGAGLYAAFGGGVVAILDAATFAGSALFLSRMRVPEEKPEPPEHHFLREVTAGIEHVWRTLPLRQITIGATLALLVVGFSETLIFSVLAHLGHKPSFFGVLATLQGVGSIAGGVTAAWVLRRTGDVRGVGIGLGLFGACALLLAVPSTAVVLVGFVAAGVGIVWAIVAFNTALQTRTPLMIQGRVSAAADLSLSLAQTTSIATGAALSTLIDYRILLVAMAAVLATSAVYLVTRREPLIPAEVSPLAVD